MIAGASRPFGGPTDLSSKVLLVLFVGAVLLDQLVGGASVRRGSRQDRGTFWLIQAAQAAALAGALVAPRALPQADLPDSAWVAGAVAMVAGATLRWRSLLALGQHFHRNVQVLHDQDLVTTGPYRRLRHPSYTAALLLFGGIGLGQANIASVAVAFVLPAAAYSYRIAVEETEMRRVLGVRYEQFASTRQRLIPWIY